VVFVNTATVKIKKGEVITTSPFLVTGTFGYGAQFFLVPVI